MADDDLWHVRLAPDDVKQLTLEQLDDLFRLEVIEASTLIWQPGMSEWLPLSVVAGLGDEDPDPVVIPVSLPPPPALPVATKRMAQTETGWPPRQQAVASWPPGAARAVPPHSAPPPPSNRQPPPSARPPNAAPVSAWPPPAAWSNPPPAHSPVAFASTLAEPPHMRSAPPTSAPPPPLPDPFGGPISTAPFARPEPMSQAKGGGSWVVALAFAAGLVVTLYRNDVVHAAARSVGQESAYLNLEKALGGPGFGTPRAVEQMAAAAAALTAALPTSEPSAPTPAPTTTSPAATTTATPAETAAAPSAPAAPSAAETAAAPSKPASAPPPAAAPRAASRPAAPAAEPVDTMFKTTKKGKKAKGNEYDPLNGSL